MAKVFWCSRPDCIDSTDHFTTEQERDQHSLTHTPSARSQSQKQETAPATASAGKTMAETKPKETKPKPQKPKAAPLCSLCRVAKTEEHVASNFHSFNEGLQGAGKMPMSEDLFNQFEAHKYEKGGVKDSAAAAKAVATAVKETTTKNVNQWHWEEKNVFTWASERIPELLKEAEIPVKGQGTLKITGTKDLTGDAYLNMRKGKIRVGFEIKMTILWEGEIKDADGKSVVKCTGKANVIEISDDLDDDEYEEQVCSFSLEKDSPKGSDVLLKVMKKEGKKAIVKQFLKWNGEIRDMAKKPPS